MPAAAPPLQAEAICHISDLRNDNLELWRSGDFSDVTIALDPPHTSDLHLHRLILRTCEYFSGMFGSDFKEQGGQARGRQN